jgi:hypothetical protein
MARQCTKCGGTGLKVDDSFCTCTEGKLKRAIHDAKAREKEKKAEEELKALQADVIKKNDPQKKVDKIKKEVEPQYYNGQWVEDTKSGVIGIVDKINGGDVRFMAHHHKANREAQLVNQNGWISITRIKPAPLEFYDEWDEDKIGDMLHEMARMGAIDRALDAGDKDLFLKLTQKPKDMPF